MPSRESPGPGDVHVDGYLTDLSEAYIQSDENFIAGNAFPVIPVQKKSDKVATYDKGDFFRDEVTRRAPGAKSETAGYGTSDTSYSADEWSLAHPVDDQTKANADDPYQPREDAVDFLTQKMLIRMDAFFADNFGGKGNWSNSSDGDSDFTKIDNDSGSPLELVEQEIDNIEGRTGFMPNTLVMGRKVWRELKFHTNIRDIMATTSTQVATTDLLAQVWDLDQIIVARSLENTAAEGSSASISRLFPEKDMLLMYSEPNPGLKRPTAGYTFAWTGLVPGQTNAFGGVIEERRNDARHSDVFEIRAAWDQVKMADDLAHYFEDVVA